MWSVSYTYYICTVKLENFNLSHVPVYIMSQEQLSLYAMYMGRWATRPDLFGGSSYVGRYYGSASIQSMRSHRKHWRTNSLLPSSRKRKSILDFRMSGAAAHRLHPLIAPASFHTSTTTAASAGILAVWARKDCGRHAPMFPRQTQSPET